jgi:hypothetical protein
MVVLHNDNRPSVKEVMGRIRKAIRVGNRDCWTLFDSGARHSYITRSAAAGLDLQPLLTPRRSMLGGSTHEVTHVCLVQASVDGHPLEFQASVIDEIGQDEDGRVIDVLFGAIPMQLWGIRLDPQNEVLDLSHFTRDFLEFQARRGLDDAFHCV